MGMQKMDDDNEDTDDAESGATRTSGPYPDG